MVITATYIEETCIHKFTHFFIGLVADYAIAFLIPDVLTDKLNVLVHGLESLLIFVVVGGQEKYQHVRVEVFLIVLVTLLRLQIFLEFGQLFLLEVIMLDLPMEVHTGTIGFVEIMFLFLVEGEKFIGSFVQV